MAENRNQAAASTAAGAQAGASPATESAPKVSRDEIDYVRSYMFEEIETKEVLHIDRLGADDIARAIERLAEMSFNPSLEIPTSMTFLWCLPEIASCFNPSLEIHISVPYGGQFRIFRGFNPSLEILPNPTEQPSLIIQIILFQSFS